jgi:hypothetical protein
MDVWYVYMLFCACVVLCLGRGLATSWSLVQGVLPSVKWSWNWKIRGQSPTGAVESAKRKYSNFSMNPLFHEVKLVTSTAEQYVLTRPQ